MPTTRVRRRISWFTRSKPLVVRNFTERDRDAQDLPLASGSDATRNQDSGRAHLAILPDLLMARIEVQVREHAQWTRTPALEHGVELPGSPVLMRRPYHRLGR